MSKHTQDILGMSLLHQSLHRYSYNHAASNLEVYSHETSQDKLSEA